MEKSAKIVSWHSPFLRSHYRLNAEAPSVIDNILVVIQSRLVDGRVFTRKGEDTCPEEAERVDVTPECSKSREIYKSAGITRIAHLLCTSNIRDRRHLADQQVDHRVDSPAVVLSAMNPGNRLAQSHILGPLPSALTAPSH